MIDKGSVTDDPGRPTRIEKAVKKEIRRRKRLLSVYSLLLFVPFTIGAAFLKYGRTDRELVQNQLNARLNPIQTSVNQVESRVNPIAERMVEVEKNKLELENELKRTNHNF